MDTRAGRTEIDNQTETNKESIHDTQTMTVFSTLDERERERVR
jgi:hypothetical protein